MLGEDDGMYQVVCMNCAANIDNYDYEKEVAAKKWNKRKIEDAQAAENKRLREALNEIKKTVEDAQDTIYPFHIALDSKDAVYILDIAKEALKGDKE